MPAPASIDPALQAELEAVYAFYETLARDLDPGSGLGGKLLYAGELDQDGTRLVRAANIAGAASLVAASDAGMRGTAIRDGVVDFLVTSLDEALRILKNEIRKRNGVSIAVKESAAKLTDEITERGVLPDLLRETAAADIPFLQGVQWVSASAMPSGHSLAVFQSPSAELEHLVLDLIPEDVHGARRWLRLSHRYLGPRARRIRSLCCDSATAKTLMAGANGATVPRSAPKVP